ncbi:MAG: hypothetical protein H6642_10755 [Caldilineaceae bacterium]|nr:hypothetical protein [Caldilineaceae bacterium]
MKIDEIVVSFVDEIARGVVEIYNEFSLQHELGIRFREYLPDQKVQFERNVSFFEFDKAAFVKREIDIVVYDDLARNPEVAIELKYPKNGQHPEQMFSFCKDIAFAEQLKTAGFQDAYVLIFADDRLFYEGREQGIYSYFRGGKALTGPIRKPTGRQDQVLYLRGEYAITWLPVMGTLKYSLIKAQ